MHAGFGGTVVGAERLNHLPFLLLFSFLLVKEELLPRLANAWEGGSRSCACVGVGWVWERVIASSYFWILAQAFFLAEGWGEKGVVRMR